MPVGRNALGIYRTDDIAPGLVPNGGNSVKKLIFFMSFILSVPRWKSFSRVHMRDGDKVPWRMEILEKIIIA